MRSASRACPIASARWRAGSLAGDQRGRTPNSVEIYAFAPGLDASKIEVTIDRGVLRISGERATAFPRRRARSTSMRTSAAAGSFTRAVSLPDDVDPAHVNASYRDGVLQVSVARREVGPTQAHHRAVTRTTIQGELTHERQQAQRPHQPGSRRRSRSAPCCRAVDVFEDDSGITLLADMPGVPKDQLELKVEGDALLIEGGVRPPTPDGLEAVYAEVRVPRYRRIFTLSRELDAPHRRQPERRRADPAHPEAGARATAAYRGAAG